MSNRYYRDLYDNVNDRRITQDLFCSGLVSADGQPGLQGAMTNLILDCLPFDTTFMTGCEFTYDSGDTFNYTKGYYLSSGIVYEIDSGTVDINDGDYVYYYLTDNTMTGYTESISHGFMLGKRSSTSIIRYKDNNLLADGDYIKELYTPHLFRNYVIFGGSTVRFSVATGIVFEQGISLSNKYIDDVNLITGATGVFNNATITDATITNTTISNATEATITSGIITEATITSGIITEATITSGIIENATITDATITTLHSTEVTGTTLITNLVKPIDTNLTLNNDVIICNSAAEWDDISSTIDKLIILVGNWTSTTNKSLLAAHIIGTNNQTIQTNSNITSIIDSVNLVVDDNSEIQLSGKLLNCIIYITSNAQSFITINDYGIIKDCIIDFTVSVTGGASTIFYGLKTLSSTNNVIISGNSFTGSILVNGTNTYIYEIYIDDTSVRCIVSNNMFSTTLNSVYSGTSEEYAIYKTNQWDDNICVGNISTDGTISSASGNGFSTNVYS